MNNEGLARIAVTAMFGILLLSGCGGGGSGGSEPPGPGSAAAPAPVAATPPATPAQPVTDPDPAPDPGPASGAIPAYEPEFEALFTLSKMHTITIDISAGEWSALLKDFDANPRNEVFRKADFFYGDAPGNGEYVANVGFRLRGNVFTRERPELGNGSHDAANALQRVHFRIKFNEQFKDAENVYGSPEIATLSENRDREFRTVRSLNLKYNRNDPTYTREVYSYDLFRRFGVQTLRQAYTRLYIRIGDEPLRYMGVYLMGEHADKSWAQRRFGKNTFVFKSLYQGHGPADLSQADMDHSIESGKIGAEKTDPDAYDGYFSAYRPAYDLKTQRTEFTDAEAELNDLIGLLTGNPTKEMLEQAIDIESLLRAQAVNVFLGNWDDYWRNGNNYYLVQNPNNDKWVFVPYDYDIVLFDQIWMFNGVASASFMDWGHDRLSGTPVLMERVLSFAEFRDQYAGYVRELLQDGSEFASVDAVSTKLSQLQAIVVPHLGGYDAVDREPFVGDLTAIEDYVRQRAATARREIAF